jgi:hypothetical protein
MDPHQRYIRAAILKPLSIIIGLVIQGWDQLAWGGPVTSIAGFLIAFGDRLAKPHTANSL